MIHICTHTCSHPFCIPWAKRIYRCGTPMVSGSEHLCWLTGGYYQQSQSWCYDIPLIRMPTMISSECLPWYPKTIIIIITKYIHRCMHTYVRTYRNHTSIDPSANLVSVRPERHNSRGPQRLGAQRGGHRSAPEEWHPPKATGGAMAGGERKVGRTNLCEWLMWIGWIWTNRDSWVMLC